MSDWKGNKLELQATLESVTDYVWRTGDGSAYKWPSVRATKAQLIAEIEREKRNELSKGE